MQEPGQAAACLAAWQVPVISPGSEVLCAQRAALCSGLPISGDDRNGGLSVAVPLGRGSCCSFAEQFKEGKVYFHVWIAF